MNQWDTKVLRSARKRSRAALIDRECEVGFALRLVDLRVGRRRHQNVGLRILDRRDDRGGGSGKVELRPAEGYDLEVCGSVPKQRTYDLPIASGDHNPHGR